MDIFGNLFPLDLEAWSNLDPQEERLGSLVEWLRGFGVPPHNTEEEPYFLILQSLPLEGSYPLRRLLASDVATLLAPERLPLWFALELGDRLVFNLLSLAAALGQPDELWLALKELLGHKAVLSVQYEGLSLLHALRRALTYNQQDHTLWPHWRALLQESAQELPGVPFDGLEGVRMMPISSSYRGRPAATWLGEALGYFAAFLSERPHKKIDFRFALDRIMSTYPAQEWHFILLEQADYHEWPKWAVDALPVLYFTSSTTVQQSDQQEITVWRPALNAFPAKRPVQILREMCEARVVKVTIHQSDYSLFDPIAICMDDSRSRNPLSSVESSLKMARHALLEKLDVAVGPNVDAIESTIQSLSDSLRLV